MEEFKGSAVPLSRAGKAALDEMLPLVYGELRRLAGIYMARERSDHTLQPTALIHEAYMKLVDQRTVDWSNRCQFLGCAAQAMRRVLLHHAEAYRAGKREGYANRVVLDEALAALEDGLSVDVLELDRALSRLAELDPRQARVVELRCFGGLEIDEIATALDLSPSTIKREWSVARLWLRRELSCP